jgi:hypothetical protein
MNLNLKKLTIVLKNKDSMMRITQLKNELSKEEFEQIHNVEFFKNRFELISRDKKISDKYGEKYKGHPIRNYPIDCLSEDIDVFLKERTTNLYYVKCPEYKPYISENKWTIYFLSPDDAIMFKLTFCGDNNV